MATKGTVSGVIANMVTLVVDGPVAQNEICSQAIPCLSVRFRLSAYTDQPLTTI